MDRKYIQERFGDLPEENIKVIGKTIQKYEDNHWWESKDSLEIAKYQIFEDILMTDFSTFHEGVEKLLGRPVYTHEFGLNVEGLRQEAHEAIEKIVKGETLDDKIANKREAQGIKTLFDYADKTKKPVIIISK